MSSEILASIKKRLKLPAIVAPMFLVSGPDAVIQSRAITGALGN